MLAPTQAPVGTPPACQRLTVSAKTGRLLLGAILGLGLVLRLVGLNWGLPWAFHLDEPNYVERALEMLKTGDPNPKYFENPSLLIYVFAGTLHLLNAVGPLAGPLNPNLPGGPHLAARLLCALIGVASVALLAWIGARLFDRAVGLLAAALLAVCFLHVRDSHFGVNDVPSTALLLACFACCVRLMQRPSLSWYLLAGLLGGLATSTKYTTASFLAPLLAAHLIAIQRTAGARAWLHPLPHLRGLGLALSATVVGFVLGTPFVLQEIPRFLYDVVRTSHAGVYGRWLGQPPDPVPWIYLTTLLQGLGLVPLLLALAGLVLAWRTRRAEVILLAVLPLGYLGFMSTRTTAFPRFAMPALPFLCIFAAFALAWLAQRIPPSRRLAGLSVLLVLALGQSLTNDLLAARLLLQTDTRILANEWVQANLPPKSNLLIEHYSLWDVSNKGRTYTPNRAHLRIERFTLTMEPEAARGYLGTDGDYVVTSSFVYDRYFLGPPRARWAEVASRYERLHRDLEARGQVLAEFAPGWGNQQVPYRLEDVATPFWSLEQYERPGPTLRVYALPGAAGAP